MQSMAIVLLIEDDQAIRESLQLALRRLGHVVRTVDSGEYGVSSLVADPPEIVVLDLMLPGIDGFEVCRQIRSGGSTPIVMLTARTDDFDVVAGLEAGADDYVIKPVEPRVLDARIRAVLRRAAGPGTAPVHEHHGDLTIDRTRLTVTKAGKSLGLTPTELRLLLELSRVPGQVLSRKHLLEAVWGVDHMDDSRLVDACVQRLRAKIEDVPSAPQHVRTVRGFGYRFGLE